MCWFLVDLVCLCSSFSTTLGLIALPRLRASCRGSSMDEVSDSYLLFFRLLLFYFSEFLNFWISCCDLTHHLPLATSPHKLNTLPLHTPPSRDTFPAHDERDNHAKALPKGSGISLNARTHARFRILNVSLHTAYTACCLLWDQSQQTDFVDHRSAARAKLCGATDGRRRGEHREHIFSLLCCSHKRIPYRSRISRADSTCIDSLLLVWIATWVSGGHSW